MQSIATVQPGVSAAARVLVLILAGDGEGRPCGIPQLSIESLGKVHAGEIAEARPASEVQQHIEVVPLAAREGQQLSPGMTDIERGWPLNGGMTPQQRQFRPP